MVKLPESQVQTRVLAYIDGFNLYFGLKRSKWQRYYWLNLQLLAQHLLKADQELVFTKYFTSRISGPTEKVDRQSTFIQALETLDDVQVYYGKYIALPRKCRRCGYKDLVQNEKMTDVNIAVEMMSDAFEDRFDAALLISGDSDLVGPIQSVKRFFPDKRVVVAFTPQTFSSELTKHAHAYFTIGRANLAKSIFPIEVQKGDGYILRCPERWLNR